MRHGDGLSDKERLRQVTQAPPLVVIDNDMVSLLQRIEAIAAQVRYYGFDNLPNGHFDRLLGDLKRIRAVIEVGKEPVPEGNMEPAQALLFIFARQLSRIAGEFNDRWAGLPGWYLDRVLRVAPLPPTPERIWVIFRKDKRGLLRLAKGQVFTSETKNGEARRYQLTQNLSVRNAEVSRIVTAHYAWGPDGDPVQLEVAELPRPDGSAGFLPASAGNIGFIFTSPILLLREGRRTVVLTLELESSLPDEVESKLLDRIFELQISVAAGWQRIEDYTLKRQGSHGELLEIAFTLDDQSPATVGCTAETHAFGSIFPALKVMLNTDREYRGSSWLRKCRLRRISLRVAVSDATLLSVYNEMGQVDPSRPFAPLGIGAERGTWFVVGNYEMAVKPTHSVDLHIRWGGLPDDPGGLADYYRDYGKSIDNDSFRLGADYLADYKWQADPKQKPLPLFASQPPRVGLPPLARAALAAETVLENIQVGRMTPVDTDEEAYDYDMRARSGFIRLTLTDPPMGFGEKRYQYLFTESLIRNLFKKQAPPYLNPPLQPVIERITMNYQAKQEIDLTTPSHPDGTAFFHLYPLGCRQSWPTDTAGAVPLFYSLESEANVLIGLQNVRGGDTVRLYFDLRALREVIDVTDIPEVEWYVGDGYQWHLLPDGAVTEDTTRNLLTGGCIGFLFPEPLPAGYYDPEGILWLRAGIRRTRNYQPRIRGIYANPAELSRLLGEHPDPPGIGFRDRSKLLFPEKEVPGLREVLRIAPLISGRGAEDDIHRRIRIADYVSHRDRAVVSRDFERLVLQEFPGIMKVKCFPAGKEQPGRIKVVIIPRHSPVGSGGWCPMASASLILRTKEYLEVCCSARAGIEVMNPRYEEIVVRCQVKFQAHLSPGNCRSRLKTLCDQLIAPWRKKWEAPRFDQSLIPDDLCRRLAAEKYVEEVSELTLVRISPTTPGHYDIKEFSGNFPVMPSIPWGLFIPAREHLFNHAEAPFGIDDMTVDDTFIVGGPAVGFAQIL